MRLGLLGRKRGSGGLSDTMSSSLESLTEALGFDGQAVIGGKNLASSSKSLTPGSMASTIHFFECMLSLHISTLLAFGIR